MKRPDALVYWAVDSAGATVYVGQTGNFPARHASHKQSSAWFSDVAAWWITAEMPADLAYVLERYAIRTLMPQRNITSHPDHTRCDRLGSDWGERVTPANQQVIIDEFEAAQKVDLDLPHLPRRLGVPLQPRRKAAIPAIPQKVEGPSGLCDEGHQVPACTPYEFTGSCKSCDRAIVKRFLYGIAA